MNPTSTVPATVATLAVLGAHLHYEVRGQGPLVLLVGSPMDARPFTPLADRLAADHTVVTMDPRGINRSTVHDPERDSTVPMRAYDLSRLLRHLDAGPATVLGSSGGAVVALALTQSHPDLVRTVIAHEPPLVEVLDDRADLYAQSEDTIAMYLAGDVIGAWRKFMGYAGFALPDGAVEQMFGGERDPQQVADEHFWFAHEQRGTVRWAPDLDMLRSVPTRIVIGIGEESSGQLCDRTSTVLAMALGIEPTRFPGGHTGFAEDPDAFTARLRPILRES